jgi:hypothetical protein
VRFDLLRRRRLPDGSRERIRDVVSRAVEVFYVKLNDVDAGLRVRFDRIVTALLTALVAAERPVTEIFDALYCEPYLSFLDRELERHPVPPGEREYVSHQLRVLAQVYNRRPSDSRKSWNAFEDSTESTYNALAAFAPGTVLGDIFGEETFPLEDVAYGTACLSVTTREAKDLTKVAAYQGIHAMLHALCLHRQDVPGLPNLLAVIDEPWWLRRNVPGILAVSRNLNVSYVLSHQADLQFEDIGLRSLPGQLPALTNLQIRFRPATFEDAEDEVLHMEEIQPDGLVLRFGTSSASEADTNGGAIARSWANARRSSPYGEFEGATETGGEVDTSNAAHTSTTVEHEVLNVVGFGDQVKYRAQAKLRRPRFTGVVNREGWGTEIAFAPGPLLPHVLDGVPIFSMFRDLHDEVHREHLLPRTPYAPQLRLSRADPDGAEPRSPRTATTPPNANQRQQAATPAPPAPRAAAQRTASPPHQHHGDPAPARTPQTLAGTDNVPMPSASGSAGPHPDPASSRTTQPAPLNLPAGAATPSTRRRRRRRGRGPHA